MALRELVGAAEAAPVATGPIPARWPAIAPHRVDLTHLPETGSALFGREEELRPLDEAWAAGAAGPARRIVALTADGGVGKTTLVNRWLDDMKREQAALYLSEMSADGSAGRRPGRRQGTDRALWLRPAPARARSRSEARRGGPPGAESHVAAIHRVVAPA